MAAPFSAPSMSYTWASTDASTFPESCHCQVRPGLGCHTVTGAAEELPDAGEVGFDEAGSELWAAEGEGDVEVEQPPKAARASVTAAAWRRAVPRRQPVRAAC